MKYFLLSLAFLMLFACSKNDIDTEQKLLPMESISGTVHVDGVPANNQEFTVLLLDITTDSSGVHIDTLATEKTINGLYVFDQIIPSDVEHYIYIDDHDGYNFEYGLDESPDGDPHDENSVGRTIGVVLESDEIDSDNNYYFTTITTPCPSVISGYVYIVDVFGVQTPSTYMDIHLVERQENGEPTGIIYQFGETDDEGYYEFIVEVEGEKEFAVKPSILDYPFLFTELEETIITDETPDDDPIINIADGYLDVDVDSCEIDDQNNFSFILKNIPNQITGNVLIDLDKDGIIDGGKSHMRVELFNRDANGQPFGEKIEHKFTDAEGAFKFSGVQNGEYVLVLKKNETLDITNSYDENIEAGEPDNPVINYISVNLENNLSDHFNYFTLEYHDECDIELSVMPYWAFCDTNLVCQLDELPLIIVDKYLNPMLIVDGLITFNWENLTTGQTSNSDVLYWYPNDIYKVDVNFTNGCSYEIFYNRECPQDFEGQLNLIEKTEGAVSETFGESDIMWSILPYDFKLTISYNITQPSGALDPGIYDYTIVNDILKVTNSTGIEFELGKITFNGTNIVLEDNSGTELVTREFSKS